MSLDNLLTREHFQGSALAAVHVTPLGVVLAIVPQMAMLAKGAQVLAGAVRFVMVQMGGLDKRHSSGGRMEPSVTRVTVLATPTGGLAHLFRDLFPIGRISSPPTLKACHMV
jgi:hypothetical protein